MRFLQVVLYRICKTRVQNQVLLHTLPPQFLWRSVPLYGCLSVAFALSWLKEGLSAVSNLVRREVVEVCSLNPTDPAQKNSCLSQQLDNLPSKPQLQRNLAGSVTVGCWLILSSASAKNIEGLLI